MSAGSTSLSRASQRRAPSGVQAGSAVIEQAAEVVSRQPPTCLINALLAVSATLILYSDHADSRLFVWCAAALVMNVVRYVAICRWGPSQPQDRAPSLVLRLALLGSVVTGLLWSLLPLVFMDFHGHAAAPVTIILCGLAAGAAVQGASYAAPVAVLSTFILAPTAAGFLRADPQSGAVIVFDTALFLFTIVRSCMLTERSFIRGVIVAQEAKALAQTLKLQNAAAEAAAARLYQLANHDPLTGAPNRAAFSRTIGEWLEAAAGAGTPFYLFLLDLDHFKSINDTLGHSAGDEVLKEIAQRISASGADDRFVARLGGDEFAILVGGAVDDARQAVIADEIVAASSGAFSARGERVNLSLSLGVARYPDDGRTAEELLGRADLALYAAKDAGRQGWRRFDASMLATAELAHDLEQDLESALVDGSLEVWFQPQVAMESGRLSGFEALIRWKHPRHGWAPPPLIVAAALKTRSSAALTGLVLTRACGLINALAQAGLGDVLVAVNVCPGEIQHYDLAALVQRLVVDTGVATAQLELEITEETLLADASAIATLDAIRRTGVRLAIDDFGSGNSSLAYLRNLRVDRIKIDRCFVSGVSERAGDRILVQAILGIGRSLGLEVVAEGVESADDVLVLRALGCRIAQGYYFGRPMPYSAAQAHVVAEVAYRRAQASALSGGRRARR